MIRGIQYLREQDERAGNKSGNDLSGLNDV
jgi:hypothetical protein